MSKSVVDGKTSQGDTIKDTRGSGAIGLGFFSYFLDQNCLTGL